LKAQKVYPQVGRLGTTKTQWANFDSMVTALDRTHEHLMSFIMAELGTEVSLGPENNMIMQGNYKISIIEKLYNKYLEQYVRCQNCKNYQTKLIKDPGTKYFNMECKNCMSSRTVATIRAGYRAVGRGERKRNRQ
jgi:translation initiation factor 2 subunit 2